MTEEELQAFIANESWIFARTYANRAPHEYIVRHKINASDDEFMRVVNHIQENGVTMYFWNRPNRYVFMDGYQYWAMKGEDGEYLIINRCNLEKYKLSVEWRGNQDKPEKQFKKLSPEDLREFISNESWTFAKTYADRAPHEYIVRGKQVASDENFMSVANHIDKHGITMHFWDHPNKYIFIDGYQYWVMKDNEDDPTMVINRCNLDEYKLSIEWMGNKN